jgi:hypothetical protein
MLSKHVLIWAADMLKTGGICAVCLFWACTNPQNMAGGIEGGNTAATISGHVTDTSYVPLANVRVRLLPSTYNPVKDPAIPDSLTDTTDHAGHYSIKVAQPGSYTIEIASIDKGYRSLITGVKVTKNDTGLARNAIARMPGEIKITLPSTIDSTNGYLYVPGTAIYSLLSDAGNTVMLDSVPAGVGLSIYYAVKSSSAQPQLVRDSIVTVPGGTMNIEYVGWKFSKKLILNTTASGAGVMGRVLDFPVLVRLTGANFNFTEAKQDGADVRFTKSDGTRLAYEIERWNAANGQGEIWVKIDTVFGNDSTHFVNMYCGNANALSESNSAAVFDTADGFRGVWHLGGNAHATVMDATIHHYDGTPSDTAPVPVGGAVGIAQSFDGVSNFIEMKGTGGSSLNFPAHGFYTVSAWAYIDSFKTIVPGWNDHIDIVTKGNFQYNLQVNGTIWQFAEFQDQVGWDIVRGNAESGKWTYVVGVRDGPQEYLYVNGMCVDSSPGNDPGLAPRDTTKNLCIGRFSGLPLYYFDGKIDEVRISNVSRSADWEKLCYMNQKSVDALIRY